MFKKILIANRGEIAVRVIRTCQEMGINTVAVYSEVDRNSLHVMLANEAYHIGPSPSAESYLQIDNILKVAKESGAEAIHPGYGFLSENAQFASKIKQSGLTFIGPSPENLTDMGDKLTARELMKKAGVPIVPGSPGPVTSIKEAKEIAKQIGFPIMIKASAGGGGKGIRVVKDPDGISSAFQSCQSEGASYFNNDQVFIERFIENPKHIEIQIFGDQQGNIVHLFERECSIQRRHQKLIEESPSPSLPTDTRDKMGEVAIRAAQFIKYQGAGTIEFIFDDKTKEFFFMEMNTRLQVEHPVTEMVTSLDLVKEQLLIADGHSLSFQQKDIVQKGHAIELRICAEDPITFNPSPGTIRRYRQAQGSFVRIDGYAYPGYQIPIHYDPMIAKLIAWRPTRKECIKRLEVALGEFMLTGVKSNIILHKNILSHKKFLDGSYTTQFIDTEITGKQPHKLFTYVDDEVFLITAAIEAYRQGQKRNLRQSSSPSLWKKFGRMRQLRI